MTKNKIIALLQQGLSDREILKQVEVSERHFYRVKSQYKKEAYYPCLWPGSVSREQLTLQTELE